MGDQLKPEPVSFSESFARQLETASGPLDLLAARERLNKVYFLKEDPLLRKYVEAGKRGDKGTEQILAGSIQSLATEFGDHLAKLEKRVLGLFPDLYAICRSVGSIDDPEKRAFFFLWASEVYKNSQTSGKE